ncbi:MAG: hypothetical protein RIR16_945, partial [Actinomycetota bacterium]
FKVSSIEDSEVLRWIDATRDMPSLSIGEWLQV